MSDITYLDYAATSAIRPEPVVEAVAEYLRAVGATPGRSGHARALEAGRVALRCRRRLAELFNIPGDPGRIAFQLNATHALNTALFGVVQPGDVVVRTTLDHNAVRRPVAELVRRGAVERILRVDAAGRYDPAALEAALEPGPTGAPPRVVALPHASNVTGAVLPVERIAASARERGSLVLVDAAQTAGHFPLDVDALGIDLLAFTGHKGLLGPQGIGGLWVRPGVEVAPLLHGGTGGDSAPAEMPSTYPDHLEAGTQNGPAMAGLAAGVDWIFDRSVESLRAHELACARRLRTALQRVRGVDIFSSGEEPHVGIVSLRLAGYDSAELAGLLDRRFGIQGRAGLHCAPDAHAVMGTSATGTYRLSVGWATSEADVDHVVRAFETLVSEKN